MILFLSIFQFLVLKNIGFQENVYRSNVGQYIYDISEDKKNDTLFLEPAGYIPYYAKIKTIDTVGLTSPTIRKYRKKTKLKTGGLILYSMKNQLLSWKEVMFL